MATLLVTVECLLFADVRQILCFFSLAIPERTTVREDL